MTLCKLVCGVVNDWMGKDFERRKGRLAVWSGGIFFFQAEDGIRDAQESRGLGDVYKRQLLPALVISMLAATPGLAEPPAWLLVNLHPIDAESCLLYTSDAADDLPCVDLGGRRTLQKKT